MPFQKAREDSTVRRARTEENRKRKLNKHLKKHPSDGQAKKAVNK